MLIIHLVIRTHVVYMYIFVCINFYFNTFFDILLNVENCLIYIKSYAFSKQNEHNDRKSIKCLLHIDIRYKTNVICFF